jgi:hypothetical protein
LFFHTVPSAHTLVRWVNENAFAPIVRARPCPTFGRPVHHRGGSPLITARYFSAYPSDSTSQWTPCPPEPCREWLQVHLGCFRLSLTCPFRLLLTFSLLRPARHYSRLWIRRSSFEHRRDFNPPEQRAAQRTLWVCPTSRVRSSSDSVLGLPNASQEHWLLSGEPGISQLPCKMRPCVPGS